MPSVSLTSLVGGGGGGFTLAPDLTFPSTLNSTTSSALVTINPVGSLTTALSLTGKFVITGLYFSGLTAETITVKLTIDGVVIWNSTFTCATALSLLGSTAATSPNNTQIVCNSSFLLEIQTATDNSVSLSYAVRPIL